MSKKPKKVSAKPSTNLFDLAQIEGQHIDNHGKTRMIKYKSGLSILTSPIPPLNVKNIPLDVKPTKSDAVVAFMKANKLKGTHAQLEDTHAQLEGTHSQLEGKKAIGIWVTSEDNGILFNGYIPMVPVLSSALEKLKDAPPYFLDIVAKKESVLDRIRNDELVAEYLKQYAIWEYSTKPEGFEDRFVVVPKHTYEVEELAGRLFKNKNKVMYFQDKLIVPSEEIKKRLVEYVSVVKFNSKVLVETFKHRSELFRAFEVLSDFKFRPGELVMNGRDEYIEYVRKRQSYNVQLLPNETLTEPYFYRNASIRGGELCMIQNVFDGTLHGALGVAEEWAGPNNRNMGFGYESTEEVNTSYAVLDMYGNVKEGDVKNKLYIMEHGGKYAAMLFFGGE